MDDFWKSLWENVKSILIAVVLALIIKTSIVEAYKVPTGSMEDTILAGDFLVCNKFIYGSRIPLFNYRLPAFSEPESGDVVVFRFPMAPDTNYVKRCIAGPGQTIEIKDKIVFIDGEEFALPEHGKYSKPVLARTGSEQHTPDNFGPYEIPDEYFFMMGDNRDQSYDSRFWGPVHRELILGEAVFIHWSWKDDPNSPQVAATEPLSPPRLFIYNAAHFFERVRWNRLLNIIR